MRLRRVRLALACATAGALAFAALNADGQGPGRARRGIGEACAVDAARLCPGARSVELLLCLEGRSADLSPVCRGKVMSRLAQLREHHTLVAQACQDEAARLCPGVEPGPGQGLVRCLRQHESELSEACRTQLPSRDPR
jgi:hypothetical protein